NQTTTVGSYPRGKTKIDLFDLGGNVWEWCFDWYGEDYYKKSEKQDPVNLKETDFRSLRGGSWNDDRDCARCAFRIRVNPDLRSLISFGFRCVRTLK
ncbi:MAG: SUMF1/EgtB/PvdO family nonheme iron enzyme, partial [Desulfobacterales bacterium]|nr:SUMF1/EgtB/PvdO family nonheme iron enzyme [Desulfobacterales bacterium]